MTIKEFFEKYANVEFPEEQEKQIKECLGIKENKKWKPEEEETYYLVDSAGIICERKRCVANPSANMNDKFRILTNNCFKTKEEAEFRLEQIKVYNELKNFADENNEEIDWKDNDTFKHYIYYNYQQKCLGISYMFSAKYIGQIYFSSEKLAQQAIEKVGAGRIKKYLFGVE